MTHDDEFFDDSWYRKYRLEEELCNEDSHDGMTGICRICGEGYDQTSPLPSKSEVAEMYDPNDETTESLICHAQCGIDAQLELA